MSGGGSSPLSGHLRPPPWLRVVTVRPRKARVGSLGRRATRIKLNDAPLHEAAGGAEAICEPLGHFMDRHAAVGAFRLVPLRLCSLVVVEAQPIRMLMAASRAWWGTGLRVFEVQRGEAIRAHGCAKQGAQMAGRVQQWE